MTQKHEARQLGAALVRLRERDKKLTNLIEKLRMTSAQARKGTHVYDAHVCDVLDEIIDSIEGPQS